MAKENKKIKQYEKYALVRLAELIEGRIDKQYFDKDLANYRQKNKIKKKKYWV